MRQRLFKHMLETTRDGRTINSASKTRAARIGGWPITPPCRQHSGESEMSDDLVERLINVGDMRKVAVCAEAADVLALLHHAIKGLDLDQARIAARRDQKIAFKAPWFEDLRARSATP